jgi:hypothetical protein
LWPVTRVGLLGAVLQLSASAAQALEARARAALELEGPAWVGQEVVLKVELMTDGLSFSGQRIRVPDVPGALVLEDAVSTVNLSEQVDGETWQVLSYRYPVFAQRAGRIELPPMDVAFAVSEGYGSEPVPFELQTEALSLEVRSPPGVEDLTRLVTTTEFSLEVSVTPEPAGLKVGDALTRTVRRTAKAVSGMAFAPLPTPDVPGVAVYPKAPEVDDTHNRGELTGTRLESVTYVLQRAGALTIPGTELQWWDPVAERLDTATVPALTIEVAENHGLSAGVDATARAAGLAAEHPWALLAGLAGMAAGLWAMIRGLPPAIGALRRWREVRSHSERARFRALVRACRSNDPAKIYNAYVVWAASDDAPGPATGRLPGERERLQLALVGRESPWRPDALLDAVRAARREARRTRRDAGTRVLPALNP